MKRLMIIDSDLNQLRLLKDALKDEYLILGCSRGTNALALFDDFQPSAVVLDPRAHDLNGREFIRKIKSLPLRRDIPILALCHITSLRQIEESFNWGADMIFSKPCSPERIQQKLNRLFVRSKPVQELELSGV